MCVCSLRILAVQQVDCVVPVPFWEWKKLLEGNRYSKAAGGAKSVAYLAGWLQDKLDLEVALYKQLLMGAALEVSLERSQNDEEDAAALSDAFSGVATAGAGGADAETLDGDVFNGGWLEDVDDLATLTPDERRDQLAELIASGLVTADEVRSSRANQRDSLCASSLLEHPLTVPCVPSVPSDRSKPPSRPPPTSPRPRHL